MKKLLIILLGVILTIGLAGCGEQQTEEAAEKTVEIPTTAQSMLEALQAVNENVIEIKVFDENTDPNGLLGRPNEYISKADFADGRLEQFDDEYIGLIGGTIEVFSSEKDCEARYEYLIAMSDPSLGAFGVDAYIYKYDTVIFRVDYDITPSEAEVYRLQMDAILNETSSVPDGYNTPQTEQTTEQAENAGTTESATTTDSLGVNFSASSVPGDVTGNWRVSVINQPFDAVNSAIDYCNKYFKSNSEIHAIVNRSDNTTTQISYLTGMDVLDVTVYQYVSGEEYSADLLFSGTPLKEYFIYKDTGNIEQVN